MVSVVLPMWSMYYSLFFIRYIYIIYRFVNNVGMGHKIINMTVCPLWYWFINIYFIKIEDLQYIYIILYFVI